jgi:hypothetical protein
MLVCWWGGCSGGWGILVVGWLMGMVSWGGNYGHM